MSKQSVSFDLTVIVTDIENNPQIFYIEVDELNYTEDDIKTLISEQAEESNIILDEDFSIEIDNWGDTPEWLQDLETLGEFIEAYQSAYIDNLEVWEAGHKAGIDFDNIEEAYSGSFNSDEEFARETADQLGAIDKEAKWPMDCIDWEQAAKELMWDYCEENGHYFRNF